MDEPTRSGSPDQRLVEWLAENEECCPVCNYALGGLHEARCPECGVALRLTVGSPQARFGPWILALVSFALALGFDAVISIVMAGLFVRFGAPPTPEPMWILTAFAVLALACAVGLLRTIRCRVRWMRMTPTHQWARSRLIFLVVGAVHLAFGLYLVATV